MRLLARSSPSLAEPPLWPPLLATRGPGAMSAAHAHHGMHIVVALRGELRVRAGKASWQRAAGVLTAPDALHAIDGTDAEVLLVFLDPESDAGSALQATLDGLLHLIGRAAADALAA